MQVSLFDFDLPSKYIAQKPANPRDSSRLLHITAERKISLSDFEFKNLPELLAPGDLIVFNNTRVVPTRLTGYRLRDQLGNIPQKAHIEATLHQQISSTCWRAFIKPAKKIKSGDQINFASNFAALVKSKRAGGEVDLAFACSNDELKRNIATHGGAPLPPYIKRKHMKNSTDLTDYQTIFASYDGAIAAPTAGLHFTKETMEALKKRGVLVGELTLHVGAGTFLPIKAQDTTAHSMHSEWGQLLPEIAKMINDVKRRGNRIIACGTTVLRLLESAAHANSTVRPFEGKTQLFITPGYQFKIVDMLLTNFHQPKSTLFILVAAFAGLERIKHAYKYAKYNNYRFYSYGDCCLIENATSIIKNG
ncbi:MAG: S-adenosylmethionine:tRNA ribosyltransferase-isomerase [Alphaproteobacteria bacterium MarineAlpha3_Bin5]|nr:tRNA preQ1(34) S-adenosylmethionine ribosyltransferase-isomerase QueA [Magnetovibrio sp.]PPR79199.1 MAG: S-adenosylmethionine:tRNA ribosyltransferase-isomerase [Alphaproteobacteria bacterium MarineAlpha3_Bin5]